MTLGIRALEIEVPRMMLIQSGPEDIGLHVDDGVSLAPIQIPSDPEPHSARSIVLTLGPIRMANTHK